MPFTLNSRFQILKIVVRHSLPCPCLVSAPQLDDGPLLFFGFDLGHTAHLLGHLHTLLRGLEVRHHLGDEPTALLGLQVTLLLGFAHNHGLDLVLANMTLKVKKSQPRSIIRYCFYLRFLALFWGAELSGDLVTGCLGGILGHDLLLFGALLPGPLLTLLLSCLSCCFD